MITSMRDAFFLTLEDHLKKNRDILVLSNDQGAPALDSYRESCPGQFINMAISEQNLISVAAGLAKSGKKVFVYGITPFVTLRCYEQIKIDLCAMNLPVTIVGVGCGYGYSTDGPTHHATEDLSVMRALANMHIFCPSDPRLVAILVPATVSCLGPLYLRLDREPIALPMYPWRPGSSHGFSVLREGTDLSLMACGNMVHRALEVAAQLERYGLSAQVIDCYQVKPIPRRHLVKRLGRIPRVVTLEEHTVHGGFGSAILEALTDAGHYLPVKRFGVLDSQLYGYGTRHDLHWQRGLDVCTLVQSVMLWLRGEEEPEHDEEAEEASAEEASRDAQRQRPGAAARPRAAGVQPRGNRAAHERGQRGAMQA